MKAVDELTQAMRDDCVTRPVYTSLHWAEPQESRDEFQLEYEGYSPVLVHKWESNGDPEGYLKVFNAEDIVFATCEEDYEKKITHFGISFRDGKLLFRGNLRPAFRVFEGNRPMILERCLTISTAKV